MNFVVESVAPSEASLSAASRRRRQTSYVAHYALDPETKRKAYRLRYDSYFFQGHIEPRADGLFEDHYDLLDNSRTILVSDEIGPVGSVRVCVLGLPGQTSPACEAFPDEIESALGQLAPGRRAAEITRLVRSPAAANDQALVFLLYRLANYIGFVENVDVLLASVRRNHAIFYRRLGFETASPPRPYPGLNCPMQLMVCDRANYERSFAQFPLIDPFGPDAGPLDGLLSGDPLPVAFLRQP